MGPAKRVGSERFAFSVDDLKKVGMGLLVVMVGAGLTWISEWVVKTDFGDASPLVVAGWAFVANVIRKLITNTERIEQKL